MKSGKVLVSVVMSVYNDEQYLKESLDSIFAQTIQDFELIIVDDCSTCLLYTSPSPRDTR